MRCGAWEPSEARLDGWMPPGCKRYRRCIVMRPFFVVLAGAWAVVACPAASVSAADEPAASVERADPAADSRQMEADLQGLNWGQFRSVVESVPKLKADVDAYGPLGWQYVQKNYATYGWKKNIDRLDEAQRKLLADLIRAAKGLK